MEATIVTEHHIKEPSVNLETDSENIRPMYEDTKAAAVLDQQNEEYVESGLLPEGSIAAAFENVGTMDESVKDDAVPDQYIIYIPEAGAPQYRVQDSCLLCNRGVALHRSEKGEGRDEGQPLQAEARSHCGVYKVDDGGNKGDRSEV